MLVSAAIADFPVCSHYFTSDFFIFKEYHYCDQDNLLSYMNACVYRQASKYDIICKYAGV